MNARFVHVGFNVGGAVPVTALEKVFDKASDWIRYNSHCWILYTRTDLDTWRDRIRKLPQIKDTDSFLLCEINVNVRSGYMEEKVWEWLAKDRIK